MQHPHYHLWILYCCLYPGLCTSSPYRNICSIYYFGIVNYYAELCIFCIFCNIIYAIMGGNHSLLVPLFSKDRKSKILARFRHPLGYFLVQFLPLFSNVISFLFPNRTYFSFFTL
jgi:hypothetical protein